MKQTLNWTITIIAIITSIGQIITLTIPNSPFWLQRSLFLILMGCASYFAYYFLIYRNTDANVIKSQPSKKTSFNPAEQAYQYFAKRYGIGNRSIEVQWIIKQDGSATLTRLIEVEAHSTTDTLETYLAIPEKKDASGNQREIKSESIESLTPFNTIKIDRIIKEEGRLAAKLLIEDPLYKGDSIEYKMSEQLPIGLYSIGLTKEQQKKRNDPKFDYAGWNINLPTRKIMLKVFFPEQAQPKMYKAEVRYASSAGFPANRKQLEETKRILPYPKLTKRPEGNHHILELEVEYPIIGFVYMLKWTPVIVD